MSLRTTFYKSFVTSGSYSSNKNPNEAGTHGRPVESMVSTVFGSGRRFFGSG